MPKPYATRRARMAPDAQARARAKAQALLDADAARAYEASSQVLRAAFDMPDLCRPWRDLPEVTRQSWRAAVLAVCAHHRWLQQNDA